MDMVKKQIAVTVAVLVLALVSGNDAPAQAQKLQASYSRQDLIRILKDEGYGSVVPHEKNAVHFKADGKKYGMYIFDHNDLQLYYGTVDVEVSLDAMNRWNREFRHSRAYIDKDGDPVLEADLLAGEGLSAAQIKNFVSVFVGSATRFRNEVLDGR